MVQAVAPPLGVCLLPPSHEAIDQRTAAQYVLNFLLNKGEKSQAEKGRRAARRPPSPPPPPGLPLPLTSQASLSPSSHRAPSTNALNALSNYWPNNVPNY